MSALASRIPERGRWLFEIACRLALAAVFAFAAIPKLADPMQFARDIDNYHALPAELVGPLAVALPVLELLVAIALVTGVHARGAALLTLGMLVAFVVAMAQALGRGIDLNCGCFGSATESQVSVTSILEDVALALLCVPVIFGRPRSQESQSAPAP